MILSLLLLTALAPEPCAGNDLACIARDSVREASAATDPRDRAEALLTAARAHLGLYRKTDERAELCKALRLIPSKHTEHLGEVPRDTRAQVRAELARLGHDCKRPTQSSTAVSSAVASSAVAEDPLIDVGRHHTGAARPAAEGRVDSLGAVESGRPRGPTTQGPDPAPAPTPRRRDRGAVAHPGRGLLIAGGLSLVSASVLGGVAAYAAVRVDQTASTYGGLAETATGQGYTTPDADLLRRDLEMDGPRWQQVRVGTSVAAALFAGAAVALLTARAVKRRRSERLTLRPVLSGLLMTARF